MKTRLHHTILLLAVLVLTGCGGGTEELPSLQETYSRDDAAPFGTFVAHDQLKHFFYRNEITLTGERLSNALLGRDDTASVFVSITRRFYLGQPDLGMLFNFINNGNTVFISSETIDDNLLRIFGLGYKNPGSFYAHTAYMRYSSVHLPRSLYYEPSSFGYFYFPLTAHFLLNDKDEMTRVLGTNDAGQPNFIVRFFGKGRLYLHCEPRVFGNYFLLQRENFRYLQQAMAYLPAVPEHVYWDDYYHRRHQPPVADDEVSGLEVLFRYPAMAWAFSLALLLMALYLLFGSKRRQRIIRPLAQPVNATAAFSETVARLYLQQKNNRNIADKMITYFLEHVRTQYFLPAASANSYFLEALSRKSRVPLGETSALFEQIRSIQRRESVSDAELLSLNQKIEKFYKIKKDGGKNV